jgi:site-specific DNA-methyltransferase (adenine-specific)
MGKMYKLHLGDCLEYMKSMPDKSVDAVITDPPYGIDYQSAWRTDKDLWKPKILNDKKPFLSWIIEAYRVTKDGGSLACFHRWDVAEEFRTSIANAGFIIKSQIIWDKVVHGMGDLDSSFAPCHENIWFAVKGDFSFHGHRPKGVLRIPRVPAEQLVHPNEKPVGLFTSLINSIVPPKGIVLDLFMGSGACGVAANKTQRDYIGMDIDPDYFKIAEKRIHEATLQPQLFTANNPVEIQQSFEVVNA